MAADYALVVWPLVAQPSAVAPASRRRNARFGWPVYFTTDVVPSLTKLGCNSGGCHGKATGQNGFNCRCSASSRTRLRGDRPGGTRPAALPGRAAAEPAAAQGDRRPSPTAAASGSTSAPTITRHLLRWIERGQRRPRRRRPRAGADRGDARAACLRRRQRRQLPLQVTAHFSDGTVRDVTRQAVYQSNEPDVAEVTDAGVVQTRSAAACSPSWSATATRSASSTAPCRTHEGRDQAPLGRLGARPTPDPFVDRHLAAQWQRLGIVPSPPADRRRVHPPGHARHLRHAAHARRGQRLRRRHAARQAGPADRPPARTAGVRQLLRPEVGRHPAEPRPRLQHQPAAAGHGPVRRLDPRLHRRQQALRPVRRRDPHRDRQPGDQPADGLVSHGAHDAGLRGVGGAGVPRRAHPVRPVPPPPGRALEPGRLLRPGRRLRPRRPQGRLRRRRGADRRDHLPGRRGRGRPSADRAGDAARGRWAARTSRSAATTTRAAAWPRG